MKVKQARLDVRQERVLLRLVEAMHLVDEDDGRAARVVRAACARSTASRISLTPPSTADMAMNWASNASAIRRASVVLPTPGGPHRIIECSRPDSKATRKRLAGAEQVALADHLVERAAAAGARRAARRWHVGEARVRARSGGTLERDSSSGDEARGARSGFCRAAERRSERDIRCASPLPPSHPHAALDLRRHRRPSWSRSSTSIAALVAAAVDARDQLGLDSLGAHGVRVRGRGSLRRAHPRGAPRSAPGRRHARAAGAPCSTRRSRRKARRAMSSAG